MAVIETWFNQVITHPVKVQYIDGNVFSQDNNGNLIGVNVLNEDGTPATLSGTVAASVIRADGATVAVAGTLSDNKCSVVLPQACYLVPGVLSVVIKLTSGEDITTVGAVVANVYQSSTDTVVDPGTIIPDIATLVEEIEEAVASIPADYSSLWATIAPVFSSSTAYAMGQYVTYNGGLYRFKTDHAAGSWNANQVEAVSVGGELYNLENTVITAFENVVSPTETKNGYYQITTTAVYKANANWKSYIYDVTSVGALYVKAYAYGTGTYQYCIIDSSNNVLSKGMPGTDPASYWEGLVFIPQGADKLIVITKSGTSEEVLTNGQSFVNHGVYSSGSLNNAIEFGTYCIINTDITGGNVTDLPPTTQGGTVLNLLGFGASRDNVLQVYVDINNSIFARFLAVSGSTVTVFRGWRPLTPQRIILTDDTKTYYGSNASDFPYNTEILINKTWYSDTDEFPAGLYVIKTIAGSISANSTDTNRPIIQIAYTVSNAGGSAIIANNMTFMAIRDLVPGTVGAWKYTKMTGAFKHYVAFGDSVCHGNHPDATKSDYSWPEAFARANNFIVNNKAIGGQGYVNTQYVQTTALETIQASGFTGIDLATLAYGINDAQNPSVEIGTINDTTTSTVMGSLYQCISWIYSRNPKIQVVVIGATPQNGTWSERLAEINEKEKLLCEKYRIPFIDMHDCPINGFNGLTGGALTSDGTHFNDDGYQLLSQFIVARLSAVCTNAY